MQKKLKKILEELNKEVPRLDYVRGMLEVLIEEDEFKVVPNVATLKGIAVNLSNNLDEAALLDAKAKASIETIKKLSEQSGQA